MLGLGIVGLPNVGKSTLFNALARARALVANYPFATIDKNVGVVALPDPRLDTLARLSSRGDQVLPTVPTTVEFVDIAGLVKGASRGEGLGNQFLAHIREVAAIAQVARCFEDPQVVHLPGRVDPVNDIEIINTELAMADIATLEKRLDKLRRSAKASKEDAALVEAGTALIAELSQGTPARRSGLSVPPGFNLLTAKPVVYVCNVNESDVVSGNHHVAAVQAWAQREGAEAVVIAAKIEAELAELAPEEAREFLCDLGLSEPGLIRLIRVGYQVLGLVTFLTANDKEARAWTVRRGTKAPQAAGAVHSDFERGFIRAEVIAIDKLAEAGGMPQARAKGWLRSEGKEYVVEDGDVIHFLFNV